MDLHWVWGWECGTWWSWFKCERKLEKGFQGFYLFIYFLFFIYFYVGCKGKDSKHKQSEAIGGGTINGGYHALYLEEEKKKKKNKRREISCFTMVNTTQRRLCLIWGLPILWFLKYDA